MQETVYKVIKDAAATTDEEKYEVLTYGYETDHTPDKRNSKVQLPFNVEQNFAYDGLGRTKEISLTDNLVKDIYYAKYGDHATNRVNSVWYGINGIRKDNIRYTYDKAGNIATVTENGVVTRYVYDGLNRLIREDNPTFGKVTYEYDNAGNILCKTVKGKKYRYTYPQDGWKDQLLERRYKEYDGTEVIERFQYDSLGNPTVYRNKSLTWQCRRLMSHDTDNGIVKFTYDVTGIRTSKEFDEVTTKYIYDGNNLIAEQRGNNWIYYIYGVDGVAGFNYQGKTYLYRKNVQGDVTHIYKQEEDKSLTLVAEYVYDAWGNWEIVVNNTDNIANINPFRYRSYYFDVETGLYYLQTRYYDPELCRFISADSIEYLDPETLGGLNLYAYCGNNPVMAVDPEGTSLIGFLIGLAITWAISSIVSHYVGEHFVSGASSIVGGVQTISTGISLLAFGPVGWVLGGIAIALGIADIALGTAELQEHFTGNNWIKDIGISDTAYDAIYTTVGIASTIVNIAGVKYMNSPAGKLAREIQSNAKHWNRGTFKTRYGSLKYHLHEHGLGLSPTEYTNRALDFYSNYQGLLKENYSEHYRMMRYIYKNKFAVGCYDKVGKIFYFIIRRL